MSNAASAQPADQNEALWRVVDAARGMAGQMGDVVMAHPLLRWALIAMALMLVGGWLRRPAPMLSGVMRLVGNMLLIGSMAMLLLRWAPIDTSAWKEWLGEPEPEATAQVSGRETRIALSDDGHFWVRAMVNGVPRRFLIDTGATYTTLSPASAQTADVAVDDNPRTIALNTANGASTGAMASINELKVGNVVARKLDVVVAPGLGDTNVLGMNFLNRLAGWRVEGKHMILVPRKASTAPKPDDEDAQR